MRTLSTDPVRNFKFIVTIAKNNVLSAAIGRLAFMTCEGFGIQNEVIPYREGGDNTTTRKMPGQTDFGPITLGRGAMANPQTPGSSGGAGIGTSEMYDWLAAVFSVMEGSGTNDGSENSDFRTDLNVDVLEHPVTSTQSAAGINQPPPVKMRFHVQNAWPMAMNWSGLDAGGNAVLIESMQLAHEGFSVQYSALAPGKYIQ